MAEDHAKDMENNGDKESPYASDVEMHTSSIDEEIARARKIQRTFGPLRALRQTEIWLDSKLGIETQGIDRIPEVEKRPPSIINTFFLWWSMTMHVGALPIGVLGPAFGLSLNQSIAGIVVGTFLGALCVAYTGTLGPRVGLLRLLRCRDHPLTCLTQLGLRQIACARYSFGFWGAKLCSILNVIIGGGFCVVNVVICGQILSAVSDYTMSISVGCVIIAVLSYLISVFGFGIIHTYEKYAWIPTMVLLCVLIGQAAPHVSASVPAEESGLALAGAFLSFLALNFSSSSTWCSIASDYYCNYPAATPSSKIFGLTLFGVIIPTTFVTVIGACIGNAALSVAYPPYADGYSNHGLGGLIREIYHPLGWSKFSLVILVFSVMGNNIANFYSSGLCLQLLGHHFHAVPRFIWSFLFALVAAVLAIAGKDHLSTIVNNFVSLLGYWSVSFTLILLIEDKFFRRHEGYNLSAWDQPSKLPWGAAAVMALLIGYLAGGVTGMSQTWYVGPIARKFSAYGGDVGIYLSAAFTLVTYPFLRIFEKQRTGR